VRTASAIARGGSLSAWLARVAYRVALKANAARRTVVDQPAEELSSREGDNPEAEAVSRELRRLLDHELDLLPEKYRAPLVLCCLEGRTQDEAARELGCPRGTVAVRLMRGREVLRQRLLRRGVALSAAGGVFGVESTRAALVCETVRAGLLHAAGGAAGPRAVALAEGVLRTMWLNNLKGALVGVAAVLVLGGIGTGVVFHGPVHAGPGDGPARIAADKTPPPPEAPPPAPNDALAAVLARWTKHAEELKSVVLHFEQTQNQRTYEGTLKYLQPDRFLVEVRPKEGGELTERLIGDGKTVLEMLPQQKQSLRTPASEQNLPVPLLVLQPDALGRRFEMRLVKVDDWYLYLSLTPRPAEKRVTHARLVLNKQTGFVRQIWVQLPGNVTVTWDVLKMDTKIPLKADEFRIPELPGWTVIDEGTSEPRPGSKLDVFEGLIEELSKSQRGNEEVLDAIYLAVLARYPSESEQKVLADQLARQKDRSQSLRELVGRLVGTREFRRKMESLTGRLQPSGR
jgi:outer membrane lipoprotein-sorting protein